MLELFECMLCFDRWCKLATYWSKNNATVEAQLAKNAIRLLLNHLVNTLPRHTGNGWVLSKIHELLHVPMFITWFGAPMNYHTGACEHNHKYQAKIPGRCAAKNQKTFTKSVARNIVDAHVLEVFMDLLNKHETKPTTYEEITDDEQEQNDDQSDDGVVDESTARATTCKICVVDNMIVAKWNSRSVIAPTLSRGLLLFIASHFGLQEDATESVTLFTQYKRDDTLFRCHPNYRGGLPWYDWVMMLYSDANHPGQQFMDLGQCPTIVCMSW